MRVRILLGSLAAVLLASPQTSAADGKPTALILIICPCALSAHCSSVQWYMLCLMPFHGTASDQQSSAILIPVL